MWTLVMFWLLGTALATSIWVNAKLMGRINQYADEKRNFETLMRLTEGLRPSEKDKVRLDYLRTDDEVVFYFYNTYAQRFERVWSYSIEGRPFEREKVQ